MPRSAKTCSSGAPQNRQAARSRRAGARVLKSRICASVDGAHVGRPSRSAGTTRRCSRAPRSRSQCGRQPSALRARLAVELEAYPPRAAASPIVERTTSSPPHSSDRRAAILPTGDRVVAVRARSSRRRASDGSSHSASASSEVAAVRVEHVLPGRTASGLRTTTGVAGERAAHQVGDQAIGGPVAAADHVAGARGRERGSAPGRTSGGTTR